MGLTLLILKVLLEASSQEPDKAATREKAQIPAGTTGMHAAQFASNTFTTLTLISLHRFSYMNDALHYDVPTT